MSLAKRTKQLEIWEADFGREYTERNPTSPAEIDATLEEPKETATKAILPFPGR